MNRTFIKRLGRLAVPLLATLAAAGCSGKPATPPQPAGVKFCGKAFAQGDTNVDCAEEVSDLRPLTALASLKSCTSWIQRSATWGRCPS